MFIRVLLCFHLIGFCTISVYGRTDMEIKAWFMRQGIECHKDYPLTPEEMLILHKHKMPDSNVAKCLVACIFKKADMLDSKGMYNWEKSYKMAEADYSDNPTKIENMKKLADMCKKVNDEAVTDGETGCERAHHLFDCLIKNAPEMGFEL